MSTQTEVKFKRASIYVLDISGSMRSNDCENKKSRLENAKEGIQGNLEMLRNNSNNYVECKVKIVPFDDCAHLDELPVMDVTHNELYSKISSLQTRGGTAIFSSMCQVLDKFTSWFNDPTCVDFILLTDGEDNSSEAAAKARLSDLEQTLKKAGGILKCVCFVITKDTQSVTPLITKLKNTFPSGTPVETISDAARIPDVLKDYGQKIEKNFEDMQIKQRLL